MYNTEAVLLHKGIYVMGHPTKQEKVAEICKKLDVNDYKPQDKRWEESELLIDISGQQRDKIKYDKQ